MASYATSNIMDQTEIVTEESFVAAPSLRKDLFARSSTTVVTLGCAVAVAMALVGAAYAVDAPQVSAFDLVPKGDRVAAEVASDPAEITVEEVNLDAGISNLVRIGTRPAEAL